MTRKQHWEFFNMLIGGSWSRRFEHDFKESYMEGVRWCSGRYREQVGARYDELTRRAGADPATHACPHGASCDIHG